MTEYEKVAEAFAEFIYNDSPLYALDPPWLWKDIPEDFWIKVDWRKHANKELAFLHSQGYELKDNTNL